MMNNVAHHVLRRGMEAYASTADGKPAEFDVPTWGAALLILTTVAFMVTSISIEYTYGHLVPTLTMVESPDTALLQAVPSENPDAKLDEKKAVEPELVLVKQEPITAKFRTIIQHLRARAGFLSRFRGISLWYINQCATYRIAELLHCLHVPRAFSIVLASVITARLSMTWTHIVMSESSSKYWFQRLPNYRFFTKIAMPTAVLALSEQVTIGLPAVFFVAMRLDQLTPEIVSEMSHCQKTMVVFRTLTLVALGLFSAVAIVVPAKVTLTRVQASLLSDTEEPIVPFDRSFGGKVVPTSLGGSGVISMLDAWKTFDWSSRLRVLKVYAKVAAMQVTLLIFTGAVIFGELRMITGSQSSAALISSLSRPS